LVQRQTRNLPFTHSSLKQMACHGVVELGDKIRQQAGNCPCRFDCGTAAGSVHSPYG
jgi:hypothetical protein